MAFFKFRKGRDDSQAIPRQPESIEAMRRRAWNRLIGAGASTATLKGLKPVLPERFGHYLPG